ncbi:hypothetical protein SCHPADRAFT_766291, partial [Schizopora paradoxa]
LPIDRRHFRVVHIFLTDYETGVDLRAFANAISRLHRTGCADLWIHSSFLAEPGRFDIFEGDEIDPVPAHNLLRLCVHSPAMLSASLIPWLVYTLESGTSLTSVDVMIPGLGPSQWATILPRISLSCLRDLRLVGVSLPILLRFLDRHPFLNIMHLDGLEVEDPTFAPSELDLPRLTTIEGNEVQISRFLSVLKPSTLTQYVNVVFRDDYSLEGLDSPPAAFDAEACLSVLRSLAHRVAGFPEAYIALLFNISSIQADSAFFGDLRQYRNLESRPERNLSLDRLEININSQTSSEAMEILNKCMGWLRLFGRIRLLRIWVGGDFPQDMRKVYVEQLSESLKDTVIFFSA